MVFYGIFLCIFLMPAFNFVINFMPKKQFQILIIALITIFSILPTIFQVDVFETNDGYSVLWLGILYVLGGYIKKYDFCQGVSKIQILSVYILCIVFTWGIKLGYEYFILTHTGKVISGNLLVKYTLPTIVLAAVSLLLIFARMHIDHIKKFIMIFSTLSFSVYLIHTQSLVWGYVMKDRFVKYADFNTLMLFFAVLVTAVVIYMSCSLLDMVRTFVFWRLCVKKVINRILHQIIGESGGKK